MTNWKILYLFRTSISFTGIKLNQDFMTKNKRILLTVLSDIFQLSKTENWLKVDYNA